MSQKIVELKPGKVPGFRVESDTLYVRNAAGTEVTSPFHFGATKNVIIAGVKYSGGAVMIDHGGGNNLDVTFRNLEVTKNCPNLLDTGGKVLQYNGTRETCIFSNLVFDGLKSEGRTIYLYGTWENNTSYWNVLDGVTFQNVERTVGPDAAPVMIFSNSLYKLRIKNWHHKGGTTGNVDAGMIWLAGNFQIDDLFRDEAPIAADATDRLSGKPWGYITRCWGCQLPALGGDQSCHAVNVLDMGSKHYGSHDWRVLPEASTKLKFPILGTDFTADQHTSGNKMVSGYVAPVVVGGNMFTVEDPHTIFKIYIKRSLSFNTIGDTGMDNGQTLFKDNGNVGPNCVITDCVDFGPHNALPEGYLTTDHLPIPGGKLKAGVGFQGFTFKGVSDETTVVTPPVVTPPVVTGGDPIPPVTTPPVTTPPVTTPTKTPRHCQQVMIQFPYDKGIPDTYRYPVPSGKKAVSVDIHIKYEDGTVDYHTAVTHP
jgi:hypothetical protein